MQTEEITVRLSKKSSGTLRWFAFPLICMVLVYGFLGSFKGGASVAAHVPPTAPFSAEEARQKATEICESMGTRSQNRDWEIRLASVQRRDGVTQQFWNLSSSGEEISPYGYPISLHLDSRNGDLRYFSQSLQFVPSSETPLKTTEDTRAVSRFLLKRLAPLFHSVPSDWTITKVHISGKTPATSMHYVTASSPSGEIQMTLKGNTGEISRIWRPTR
ncbi:MAG: hypothetical protein OHK0029_16530 [Armatimonadaceae bacterium]